MALQAIPSHSRSRVFGVSGKATRDYIITLTSFAKEPNTWHPKARKKNVFDYPTVVWRPLCLAIWHWCKPREYLHLPYIVRI